MRNPTPSVITFCLRSSTLDWSFLLDPHPAVTSGERPVSAVNVCRVLRLLSNMNPDRSSLSMVVCCPSVFTMRSSPSFLLMRHQLPTLTVALPALDRIGWGGSDPTKERARSNFSRNSIRLSVNKQSEINLTLWKYK